MRCVQITDLQHSYDVYKKGTAKEITGLKKDSRRAENEARRLATLNEKQKTVLQRKIREADEARKRLHAVHARRRAAPLRAAAVPPRSPMRRADAAAAAPPPPPSSQGGRVLPEQEVEVLKWLEEELEAMNTGSLVRTMRSTKVAQRQATTERMAALESELRAIAALPPDEQVRCPPAVRPPCHRRRGCWG